MKEYYISTNDSNQRLNKFLEKTVPRLSGGMMHKYIRLKRIKVNGKRTEPSYRLSEGDRVQLYLNDEYFEKIAESNDYQTIQTPHISILYEDENILLVDKAPGMVVHADNEGTTDTLIAHIQAYLIQKGEWNPADENSFAPALCNRIDRNTGGIVIAAKNAESLRILNERIRSRSLTKQYLCIVHGSLKPKSGKIQNFLRKDEKRQLVSVFDAPIPGGKTAVTLYRTLAVQASLSLVECELITGRTHQIRAQMAYMGCPLLGDCKYGTSEQNRPFGEKSQALYSYRLLFQKDDQLNLLSYLNEQSFVVTNVPFLQKYFPHYDFNQRKE